MQDDLTRWEYTKRAASWLAFQVFRIALLLGVVVFIMLLLGNPWGRWT